MKPFITVIVLLAIVVFAALNVKWAMDRSKVKKATLQQSFTGASNPNDNLFKTSAATVSGLTTNDEYRDEKKKQEQGE